MCYVMNELIVRRVIDIEYGDGGGWISKHFSLMFPYIISDW